jgi:hypothetical protein
MSTDKTKSPKERKWQIVYKDDECEQIWKYDTKITKNGPVSVETTWKPHILKEWKNARSIKSVRKKSNKK